MKNNDLELMSLTELAAHVTALCNRPQPLPSWLVCVWEMPEEPGMPAHLRRFYQIDMVDAQGRNAGSTNPKALEKLGVTLPDFSGLTHGQYRFADIPRA